MVLNLIIIIYMFVLSIVDIKTKTIKDRYLFIGFIISLIFIFVNGIDVYNVIGCILGFIIFLIIALITNAMGGADIKLIAILGLILKVKGILFIIVVAFIIGSVVSLLFLVTRVKNIKDEVAFIPFISIATYIYMYVGETIIFNYLNF